MTFRRAFRVWGSCLPGFLRWWLLGEPPFPRGLALLALVMTLLAWGPWHTTGEEARSMETVRRAQAHVAAWRDLRGIAAPLGTDPERTGLVGDEMTSITTTLGDLAAKRTACDPRWVPVLQRWFREAGLASGDRLTMLPSGSFPGFLLGALVAGEAFGLEIQLLPSLGSSSWGANRPDLTLLDLLQLWHQGGFVRTRPEACTLGGEEDRGQNMPEEGLRVLRDAARRHRVPIWDADGWEALRDLKARHIAAFSPDLIVQIGGGMVNLGNDPAVLDVPPGLLIPGRDRPRGNGLLAWTLEQGLPAVHLLEVRSLAHRVGIPFDAPRGAPPSLPGPAALGGIAVFLTVLALHRRWALELFAPPRP